MDINIRKGTLDDADAMADIFNSYIKNSTVIFSNRLLAGDDMRRRMSDIVGRFPFYVSLDGDGNVTGYCYAHHWMPDEVYGATWEITIYVAHDSLGRGEGSALLRQVIADSRKAGAHVLVSCITRGNARCEKMHRRAGFRLDGVLKEVGYKFGMYLDDAIYTLKLSD